MTIAPDTIEFPNNVVQLIAARVKPYVDPDLFVAKRPLRPDDKTQSVGIFPSTKVPDNTSIETDGSQIAEPTIKRYNIIIQSFVKDTDEQKAIAVHSILANRIWRMMYRDMPLHEGLTALQVVADNSLERMQRRGITLGRYLSNEIQGSFLYTNWIEFWFDTETVRTN